MTKLKSTTEQPYRIKDWLTSNAGRVKMCIRDAQNKWYYQWDQEQKIHGYSAGRNAEDDKCFTVSVFMSSTAGLNSGGSGQCVPMSERTGKGSGKYSSQVR